MLRPSSLRVKSVDTLTGMPGVSLFECVFPLECICLIQLLGESALCYIGGGQQLIKSG